MNSMVDAMKIAGMKIPTVDRRIHHWLKDRPGKRVTDIVSALKTKASTTSTMLRLMRKAGVLTTTDERQPCDNFAGYVQVMRYSVAHKEYDGLDYRNTKPPTPKLPKGSPFTVVPPGPTTATPKPVLTCNTVGAAINVESLTMGEARALYLKLKEYFGGSL